MKRTPVECSLVNASQLGFAWALLCLASSLVALAGCSDSSSGSQPVEAGSTTPPAEGGAVGVDAAADAAEAGNAGPAPIGDPVATCGNCPVCGGTLASATTGARYCTAQCTTDAECVAGTACVTNPVSSQLFKQCLKKCRANADCVGIFVCRSDVVDAGSVCWSPYPPPVGRDAGAGGMDAGGADAGPSDAGPDAGPGSDAATDGGSTGPDASDSGAPG